MKYILMVCVALCMLVGCKQTATKTEFESVGVETFQAYVMNAGVQLVDVRTPEEYAKSHIDGSKNFNVKDDSFASMVEDSLDKDGTVFVYCRSGRRSKMAADILVEKGFKVVELSTGFNGWVKAGYPVK